MLSCDRACEVSAPAGKIPGMASLTLAKRHLARLSVPAVIVLLSGCGDGSLTRTFGLTRDAPDEFTVVTRAPLSMPPDYTLRPPQPGAPRPQDQPERAAAETALVPESALAAPRSTALSQGQASLLRATGGAPSDIRQRVDQEARTTGDGLIDRILYWRKGDSQRVEVNPALEAQRLKQNAALGQPSVTGDTPIIQPRRAGWLQDLFGWL